MFLSNVVFSPLIFGKFSRFNFSSCVNLCSVLFGCVLFDCVAFLFAEVGSSFPLDCLCLLIIGVSDIVLLSCQLFILWCISNISKSENQPFFIVVLTSSSSSCRTISTDIPDLLSPPFSIIHCFRQVLRATSHIGTELPYVGSSRSFCFCSSM